MGWLDNALADADKEYGQKVGSGSRLPAAAGSRLAAMAGSKLPVAKGSRLPVAVGWTRLPVQVREHFVFLIDTSWSMDSGGVAQAFAGVHGKFLNMLADNHPGSVASCLTFTTSCSTQYVAKPIEKAPSFTIGREGRGGTDLPRAICTEFKKAVDKYPNDDITAIIVTDGDTGALTTQYPQQQAGSEIGRMRSVGTRILFLFADTENTPTSTTLSVAIRSAEQIGIRRDEVMLWGHTPQSLMKTFSEVNNKLALGAATSAPSSPKRNFFEALPPHRRQ